MDYTQSILNSTPDNTAQMQQNQSLLDKLNGKSSDGDVLSGINSLNQTQVAPQQTEDKGNWLTRLLPTIGSIAAPIAGAAFAPLTGGASLLAGLALAGAGSGVGKLAENAIEGQNDMTKDVGTSALEGVGGQILGGVAGKVLGKVGSAVSGVAGKGLAAEGATKAAEGAVNEAQMIKNIYGGVNKKVLQNNDLSQALQAAKDVGVNYLDPTELSNLSNSVGDILNSNINRHLVAGGPVNATGYTDIVKNAINQRANILGSTDAVALSKGRMGLPNNAATKVLQQLNLLGQGKSLSAMDPTEIRKVVTQLGEMAADSKPSVSGVTGAIDPIQKATYDTINDVRGQLKDILYKNPTVQESVAKDIGNLRAEDVGGNQLLADKLNDVITKAQTPQDLLDEYSKFIGMGKIGNAAAQTAKNPATAASVNAAKMALPKEEQGLGSQIVSATGNGHPIATLVGNALKLGRQGGKAGVAAQGLGDLLQRIAPTTGNVAGQVVTNSPNYVAPAGADRSLSMNSSGIGATGNAMGDIMNSNSPVAIPLQEMLNASKYSAAIGSDAQMAAYSPLAATSLEQMTAANSARKQLESLIAMYNAAGGAQGTVGGLLSQLGGGITGGPAGQYNQQAGQLAQQISKLTGTNVNAPALTMTPEAAQGVLAQMQAALSAYGG